MGRSVILIGTSCPTAIQSVLATSTSTAQRSARLYADINLSQLQKSLDIQGLEIVDNQKDNMMGRKKLAESTRDFKKLPDQEKAPVFKTLLKAYQGEIDALTKRSKTAENAFLGVYKLLAEAPDPFPLLDAAVDQTARASEARILEGELARQKEENAALRQQLSEAASAEKERKRLAEKVEQLETRVSRAILRLRGLNSFSIDMRGSGGVGQMEDMVVEHVGAKEAELHATYDERLRNYAEREKDLQRQVSVARSQLRELRTTADSSQAKLFDHSQRQDQETLARLAEADLITEDLERANSRVTEVERRNEKLRAEIEAVRSGSESAGRVSQLEAQVSDLQTEASRLMRSLEQQKEVNEKDRSVSQKEVDDLIKDREIKAQEIESLKERVRQFDDYDEIKRELEIMKYVEFAGLETEETHPFDETVRLPDPNADKANQHRGKPLENLLMTKNRKLQDELTSLRVTHEELSATHRTLSNDLNGLQSRFDEQRSLNDRLENDLLRINQGSQSASAAAAAREDPLASLNVGKKDLNGVGGSGSNAPGGTSGGFTSSADISILPIITSQRDRFRQRNAELEEELRRQFETISELRGEIKSLQTDSLKLYEKVRYLQSYRDDTRVIPMKPFGGSKGDEELGKFQNKYDESMNPFEAFRGRERGRAVHMLNPLEKVLLHLSTLVLSNRFSRNIFVVYALGLHLLVLSTLYANFSGSADSMTHVAAPPTS
ncbi:BQ5605_C010g05858 [Microbotryum silenes-dioicae]|uniref:Protein CASP n=1 Tax=Microbotryum silenes-dioicae TaxID=796604 RepID=A0A2X0LT70_9BASI|nr:BQ5605_C010g05858 [Microbotryum silenes-dioicae]